MAEAFLSVVHAEFIVRVSLCEVRVILVAEARSGCPTPAIFDLLVLEALLVLVGGASLTATAVAIHSIAALVEVGVMRHICILLSTQFLAL